MAYFPFFTEMKNRKVLVVGSGPIACSKMRTFVAFEADVTCISPQPCAEQGVHLIQKEVEMGDLYGFDVVVAATDNHRLNHEISLACRKLGIQVNASIRKKTVHSSFHPFCTMEISQQPFPAEAEIRSSPSI